MPVAILRVDLGAEVVVGGAEPVQVGVGEASRSETATVVAPSAPFVSMASCASTSTTSWVVTVDDGRQSASREVNEKAISVMLEGVVDDGYGSTSRGL
jgi:hypothetical protein